MQPCIKRAYDKRRIDMTMECIKISARDNISCRHCGTKPATWDVVVANHCCLCNDCIKLLHRGTRAILENPDVDPGSVFRIRDTK